MKADFSTVSFGRFTLRVRLAAVMLVWPLALSAAEDKSADSKAGPIPIAKMKRKSPVDFGREILPVLSQNCLACHNKTKAKADLNLETPADMIKGGESGKAIVPKHGADSLLVKVAAHQKKPVMPPRDNKVNAASFTPEELGLLKLWIDQGAKGTAATAGPIDWQPLPEGVNPIYAVAVSPDGQISAAGRANQIFIYDISTAQLVTRLTDPQLTKNGVYKPGTAHRDMVHSLVFSPDGNLLASGGYREVKLWRRTQDTRQFALKSAGKKAVRTMAASPDGNWFVTGGEDGRIHIWEAGKGKEVRTLNAHQGTITSLKFSPDGARLLSGSTDKRIRVWDTANWQLFAEVETPASVAALTWAMGGKEFVSGGPDTVLRVWWLLVDEGEGEIVSVRELKGHEGAILSLDTFWPGGTQVVSGSGDGSVRQWNLETGQMVRQYNHGGPVAAVAVRPDGKRIISGGLNSVAKLWETEKGAQVAEMKGDLRALNLIAEREQYAALATADVAYWKSTHQTATNDYKAVTERVKKATDADAVAQKAFKEKEDVLTKAKDAKTAADKALADLNELLKRANDAFAAAEKVAKAAETAAKTAKEKEAQNKEAIDKAAADATAKAKLAADAKAAADKLANENKDKLKQATDAATNTAKGLESATNEAKKAEMAKSNTENELQLARKAEQKSADDVAAALAAIQQAEKQQKQAENDLQTAKKAAADGEEPIRAVAFTPDNRTVATAGNDHLVHTWNAENGAAFDTIAGASGPIYALAFGGANTLVSGGADKDAVAWDLQEHWKLERVIGTGDANSPLADRVNALRFSPDGRQLATGGGEPTRGGEIKIWSVADGKLVKELANVHSDTVFGLDYSPDGKYLASSAADRFVKVTEVATGKVVKAFEGHTHYVMGVSWKRDGRTLASSGADNVVKIWDFVKGEKKKNVEGFSKEVTSVHFLGITDQAVVTCGDNQVRAVNEKGENVRSYGGSTDYVYASAVTPDGRMVVAGGQDSVLRVWNATNGQAIASFAPPPTAPAPTTAAKK